jgi:hypothetical protein
MGAGKIKTIKTNQGDDTFIGSTGGLDTLNLGSGKNTIITGAGWIGSIQTYDGDDTLTVGAGNAGGWAVDLINLGSGNNTITTTTGWVGSVQTYGGVDTVTIGRGGADLIAGGADQIALGGGNDTLIINSGVTRKPGTMQESPIREPRGKLYVRHEPDTELLYINKTQFRKFCSDGQVPFAEVLSSLTKAKRYKGEKKLRMGKGFQVTEPEVVLMFTHDGEDLFGKKAANANARSAD